MSGCSGASRSLGLSTESSRGSPRGPTGQGSPHCQGAGQAGGQLGASPRPVHRASPWVQGQAEARLGHQHTGPAQLSRTQGCEGRALAELGTRILQHRWGRDGWPWVQLKWGPGPMDGALVGSQVRLLRAINTYWCPQGPDNVDQF